MVDVGDEIGRYRIEAVLGEGGMGKVFRAHDEQLDRRVAIKLVRASSMSGSDAEARLLREARAAAALTHPGAVAIYDVGEHQGAPFIVMELIDGVTLRRALVEREPTIVQRLAWLRQVASALSAAHARGLVHRDIKPENVMVRDDGAIKVVDFGIARAASAIDPEAPTATSSPAIDTLTAEGVQVGTIHYMAPEQVRGAPIDGRTDQFAWGVCAYEVLSGTQPWAASGTALSVAASILTDEVPALETKVPALSHRVSAIVARTMSKRPADRFESMDALIEALDAATEGADDSPSAPPERVDSPTRGGGLRRYSSEQMRLVIGRALKEPTSDGARFSHDELVAAAREIGVDDDALDEALRELDHESAGNLADEARKGTASEPPPLLPGQRGWWNEERRHEAYRFVRHLLVYVVVNLAIWLMLSPHWQRWMLLGWGLGVAMHGVNVLMPEREDGEGKRKKRGRRGRVAHREAPEPKRQVRLTDDLERAATLLRETGERRRLRLQDSGSSSAAEAEVAEAEAAEAEAIQADSASAKRRR